MAKSIAQTLVEEGMEKGEALGRLRQQRETLLTCLKEKFEKVPTSIETKIQATEDRQKLDTWFREAIRAAKLSDIPFGP